VVRKRKHHHFVSIFSFSVCLSFRSMWGAIPVKWGNRIGCPSSEHLRSVGHVVIRPSVMMIFAASELRLASWTEITSL
jgi:hypothetical protein